MSGLYVLNIDEYWLFNCWTASIPSRNEYYPADVNSAPTQDIRKKDKDKTNNPSDQSEEEMEDDDTKWEEPDKSDKKRRIGMVNK